MLLHSSIMATKRPRLETKEEAGPSAKRFKDFTYETKACSEFHSHVICQVDFSSSAKHGLVGCIEALGPKDFPANTLLSIVHSRNIVMFRKFFQKKPQLSVKAVTAALRFCIMKNELRLFLAIISRVERTKVQCQEILDNLPKPQGSFIYLSVLSTFPSMGLQTSLPEWAITFQFHRYIGAKRYTPQSTGLLWQKKKPVPTHTPRYWLQQNNLPQFLEHVYVAKPSQFASLLDLLIQYKKYRWIPYILQANSYRIKSKTLLKKMAPIRDIHPKTMIASIAPLFFRSSPKFTHSHFSDIFCIAARVFTKNIPRTNDNIINQLHLLGIEDRCEPRQFLDQHFPPDLSNIILSY